MGVHYTPLNDHMTLESTDSVPVVASCPPFDPIRPPGWSGTRVAGAKVLACSVSPVPRTRVDAISIIAGSGVAVGSAVLSTAGTVVAASAIGVGVRLMLVGLVTAVSPHATRSVGHRDVRQGRAIGDSQRSRHRRHQRPGRVIGQTTTSGKPERPRSNDRGLWFVSASTRIPVRINALAQLISIIKILILG